MWHQVLETTLLSSSMADDKKEAASRPPLDQEIFEWEVSAKALKHARTHKYTHTHCRSFPHSLTTRGHKIYLEQVETDEHTVLLVVGASFFSKNALCNPEMLTNFLLDPVGTCKDEFLLEGTRVNEVRILALCASIRSFAAPCVC